MLICFNLFKQWILIRKPKQSRPKQMNRKMSIFVVPMRPRINFIGLLKSLTAKQKTLWKINYVKCVQWFEKMKSQSSCIHWPIPSDQWKQWNIIYASETHYILQKSTIKVKAFVWSLIYFVIKDNCWWHMIYLLFVSFVFHYFIDFFRSFDWFYARCVEKRLRLDSFEWIKHTY